jgi:hypothetical protein
VGAGLPPTASYEIYFWVPLLQKKNNFNVYLEPLSYVRGCLGLIGFGK